MPGGLDPSGIYVWRSNSFFGRCPLSSEVKALLGAGVDTFPAPDALRRPGDLLEGKGHRAGPLTGHAGHALCLFPVDLHQAEPVEPAVDCPEGAQILAEGPVDLHGQQHDADQDPQLPEKQAAGLSPQGLVRAQQGERAQQGAGGAQIFAKRGQDRKSTRLNSSHP